MKTSLAKDPSIKRVSVDGNKLAPNVTEPLNLDVSLAKVVYCRAQYRTQTRIDVVCSGIRGKMLKYYWQTYIEDTYTFFY